MGKIIRVDFMVDRKNIDKKSCDKPIWHVSSENKLLYDEEQELENFERYLDMVMDSFLDNIGIEKGPDELMYNYFQEEIRCKNEEIKKLEEECEELKTIIKKLHADPVE